MIIVSLARKRYHPVTQQLSYPTQNMPLFPVLSRVYVKKLRCFWIIILPRNARVQNTNPLGLAPSYRAVRPP